MSKKKMFRFKIFIYACVFLFAIIFMLILLNGGILKKIDVKKYYSIESEYWNHYLKAHKYEIYHKFINGFKKNTFYFSSNDNDIKYQLLYSINNYNELVIEKIISIHKDDTIGVIFLLKALNKYDDIYSLEFDCVLKKLGYNEKGLKIDFLFFQYDDLKKYYLFEEQILTEKCKFKLDHENKISNFENKTIISMPGQYN